MRITGQIVEQDLKDAGKLTRSKWYWAKFLLKNWYGIALISIVLWATVAGLIGSANPNWKGLGVAWVVISVIVIGSLYRTRNANAHNLAMLNANFPDSITIASDGLRFDGPNGATGFQTWKTFSRWREGQRVIVLYRSVGGGFFILPLTGISDVERRSLLGMLASNIDGAANSVDSDS